LCGGDIRGERLPYELHLNRDVYVVKDVPMETCVRCGERYISLETSKMLDDVRRKIYDNQLKLVKVGNTYEVATA
jgi:YgiT-type zinc finger domain-containing protein